MELIFCYTGTGKPYKDGKLIMTTHKASVMEDRVGLWVIKHGFYGKIFKYSETLTLKMRVIKSL